MTYYVDHFRPDDDPEEADNLAENDNQSIGKSLSFWEGPGAGIEPTEFRNSLTAVREDKVISSPPRIPQKAKRGTRSSQNSRPLNPVGPAATPPLNRMNACFTPYKNDLMTFDNFETIRRELKNRSEHIAQEMLRVDQEWNREPKKDWFTEPTKLFTAEHCRFMELNRRRAQKNTLRKKAKDTDFLSLRKQEDESASYDPNRGFRNSTQGNWKSRFSQKNMRSSYLLNCLCMYRVSNLSFLYFIFLFIQIFRRFCINTENFTS